jgi:phage repressor protein C with HTH and peptisase S24 domain
MSAPGSYILGLRQGRQLDRDTLAAEIGIEAQRQRWIEDGVAVPSQQERKAYAKYFGFATLDEFDDGWRAKAIPRSRADATGRIPVINLAPAGLPEAYFEVYPDSGIGMAYIDPPPGISGPNLFAFVIIGNSMEPNFPDGHYAICRTVLPEEIVDGQAVFVRLGAAREHTCTFKRCFKVDDARVELRPINPEFPSEVVNKVDIDRMSPVIACVSPRTSKETSEEIEYSSEDAQTFFDESQ